MASGCSSFDHRYLVRAGPPPLTVILVIRVYEPRDLSRRTPPGQTAMNLILLVLLVVLLIGALPAWPYSAGWGYYPSGALGTALIIILVLALLGRV